MEDLGKLIGVLILIIIVAAVIISLIPFIIYGAGVYYAGRHVYKQITQKYKLTDKAWLVLCIAGFCSLIAPFVLVVLLHVQPAEVDPLFVLSISLPFFLITAITILGIWGEVKQQSFLTKVNVLKSKENEYSKQMSKNDQDIKRLLNVNAEIEQQSGDLIHEVKRIEEKVRELCYDRALQLKKRELEETYMKLSSEELSKEKKFPTVQEPTDDKALSLVKTYLITIEELKRETGKPYELQKKIREKVQRLSVETQRIKQDLDNMRLERTKLEDSHKAFISSRIILD